MTRWIKKHPVLTVVVVLSVIGVIQTAVAVHGITSQPLKAKF